MPISEPRAGSPETRGRASRHPAGAWRLLVAALSLLTAVVLAQVLAQGWDYYATPFAERPHHARYHDLRPAGSFGHGLGVVGSAAILLLLLYSVRKRSRRLQSWGSLPRWLGLHIWLGVTGPALITLHTSFKVEGLVAVSYWSMVAVALSGLLGRYLYQQVPRNLLGEAVDLEQAGAMRGRLDRELVEGFGCSEADLAALDRLGGARFEAKGPSALPRLAWRNLRLSHDLRLWERERAAEAAGAALRRLARERVLLARRLQLYHSIKDLFHYWHIVHKPFAIVMILIMLVHVAVTVAFGARWLF